MAITRRPTVIVGALILGAAVVLAAWPESSATTTDERELNRRAVRIAAVESTDAGREVQIPGVTRAARRADRFDF